MDDLEPLRSLEQKVIDSERPYNDSIKALGAQYYDIEQLILSDNSYMLLAEVDDALVATGYAKIRQSKPSLSHRLDSYLGFMYVDPSCRGQGVNKQIIDRLIHWSREQGVSDFYLDVYSANAPALKAYLKAGFAPSMTEMKLSL